MYYIFVLVWTTLTGDYPWYPCIDTQWVPEYTCMGYTADTTVGRTLSGFRSDEGHARHGLTLRPRLFYQLGGGLYLLSPSLGSYELPVAGSSWDKFPACDTLATFAKDCSNGLPVWKNNVMYGPWSIEFTRIYTAKFVTLNILAYHGLINNILQEMF